MERSAHGGRSAEWCVECLLTGLWERTPPPGGRGRVGTQGDAIFRPPRSIVTAGQVRGQTTYLRTTRPSANSSHDGQPEAGR